MHHHPGPYLTGPAEEGNAVNDAFLAFHRRQHPNDVAAAAAAPAPAGNLPAADPSIAGIPLGCAHAREKLFQPAC